MLEHIHEFAHTCGFEIEFVEPAENVCIATRWLANPDKGNLSLVTMFEHLYSESMNADFGSTLVQDVEDRVAAATAPKLGAVDLPLQTIATKVQTSTSFLIEAAEDAALSRRGSEFKRRTS